MQVLDPSSRLGFEYQVDESNSFNQRPAPKNYGTKIKYQPARKRPEEELWNVQQSELYLNRNLVWFNSFIFLVLSTKRSMWGLQIVCCCGKRGGGYWSGRWLCAIFLHERWGLDLVQAYSLFGVIHQQFG